MVNNRITDGKRIAELLASEVTGLAVFADLEVVDADRDVVPDESGPVAYRLASQGEAVGTVRVFPARIEVSLDVSASAEDPGSDGTATMTVTDGASVKDAVDWLRTAFETSEG